MDNIYKNTKDCNPNKKRKILNVFGDMIADVFSNKKLQNYLLEVEKLTFLLFPLHNFIFSYQKILE